jgi:Na+-translocating ferredoxin:NAD+ oxidoreductase subunit G
MLESMRMIGVLTLISAVSSLGLAAFNNHAQPIIRSNEKTAMISRQLKKVISDVTPPDPCVDGKAGFDNDPSKETLCVSGTEVYRCRKGDEVVGYALKTIGDNSYSGTITCLTGLAPDGKVLGIEIVKHAETPGLGSEIENCAWRKQFVGKGPSDMIWSVKKDGGDVDAISGATISSRAVLNCLTKAQELLKKNADALASAKPMTEDEMCNAQ